MGFEISQLQAYLAKQCKTLATTPTSKRADGLRPNLPALDKETAATRIQRLWRSKQFRKILLEDSIGTYHAITESEVSNLSERLFGRTIAKARLNRKPKFVPVHPETPKNAVYYRSDDAKIYDKSWRKFVKSYVKHPDFKNYYYVPVTQSNIVDLDTIIKAYTYLDPNAANLITKENSPLVFLKIKKEFRLTSFLKSLLYLIGYRTRLANENLCMKVGGLGIKSSLVLSESEKGNQRSKATNMMAPLSYSVLAANKIDTVAQLKSEISLKKLLFMDPSSPNHLLSACLYKLIKGIPDKTEISKETLHRMAALLDMASNFHTRDYDQLAFTTYCIIHELTLLAANKKLQITYQDYKKETSDNAISSFGIQSPNKNSNYQFVALPANSGTNAMITILELIKKSAGKNKQYKRVGNTYYEFETIIPTTNVSDTHSNHDVYLVTNGPTVWPNIYPGSDINKVIRDIVNNRKLKSNRSCTIVLDSTSGLYQNHKIDDDLKSFIEDGSISILVHESHQKFGLLHTDQAQYGRVFGICSNKAYPKNLLDDLENKAGKDLQQLPDKIIASYINIHAGKTLERIKERHFANGDLLRDMVNKMGINQTQLTPDSYSLDPKKNPSLFVCANVGSNLSSSMKTHFQHRSSFGHFNSTWCNCVSIDRLSASASDKIDTLIEGTTLCLGANYSLYALSQLLNQHVDSELFTDHAPSLDKQIYLAGLAQALVNLKYKPTSQKDIVRWQISLKYLREYCTHLSGRRSIHELSDHYDKITYLDKKSESIATKNKCLKFILSSASDLSFPLDSLKSILPLQNAGLLDGTLAHRLSRKSDETHRLNQCIDYLAINHASKNAFSALIRSQDSIDRLFHAFDYQILENGKIVNIAPKLALVLLPTNESIALIKHLSSKERYTLYKLLSNHLDSLDKNFPDKKIALNKLHKACGELVVHDFKQAYKSECWFGFLGNIGRSYFGQKIFTNKLKKIQDAEEYALSHNNGAAKRAFCKLYR